MATLAFIPPRIPKRVVPIPSVRAKPLASILCISASDIVAISIAMGLLLVLPGAQRNGAHWNTYASYFMGIAALIPIFAILGLYKRLAHSPVTELRRLVFAVTLLYAVDALLPTLLSNDHPYRHGARWLSWLLAVGLAPLFRSLIRGLFCQKSWWGSPVVVFYTGKESLDIVRHLRGRPGLGLTPIAMLASEPVEEIEPRLPMFELEDAAMLRAAGVELAVIALPETGHAAVLNQLEHFESVFPHLLILHSSAALYTLNVSASYIGESLAVEVKRNSLSSIAQLAKRSAELILVLLGAPVSLLAVGLLTLLVKLDSPGPAFFGHYRIGRNNKPFRVWKLRTMHVGADALLHATLERNDEARKEWERDRKLRRDPRVTRVGKFLRRASLDELPQLWNVFCGEMSLVGPRPIIAEEALHYGRHFPLYCRQAPGITGLWQVSGRNTICMSERVELDSYYVRNWSPWLDLHILALTAKAVLMREGAY